MSININLKLDKYESLGPYMETAIERGIYNAASRMQYELVDLTPVETGNLRSTFRAIPTATGISLKWGTSYADYVDKGAPPHIIKPRSAKALHFISGGSEVFTKKVNHPGQPPQNFTTIVGQAALQILKEEITKALLTYQEMVI